MKEGCVKASTFPSNLFSPYSSADGFDSNFTMKTTFTSTHVFPVFYSSGRSIPAFTQGQTLHLCSASYSPLNPIASQGSCFFCPLLFLAPSASNFPSLQERSYQHSDMLYHLPLLKTPNHLPAHPPTQQTLLPEHLLLASSLFLLFPYGKTTQKSNPNFLLNETGLDQPAHLYLHFSF